MGKAYFWLIAAIISDFWSKLWILRNVHDFVEKWLPGWPNHPNLLLTYLPTPAADKAGRMQKILLGEWVKNGGMGIGTKSMKKWGNGDSREAEAVSKHGAQLKIKFPFVFWRQVESFQNWAWIGWLALHCIACRWEKYIFFFFFFLGGGGLQEIKCMDLSYIRSCILLYSIALQDEMGVCGDIWNYTVEKSQTDSGNSW